MEELLNQYVIYQSLGREKMNCFRVREREYFVKYAKTKANLKNADHKIACSIEADKKEDEIEHLLSDLMKLYIKLLVNGETAAAVNILKLEAKLNVLLFELRVLKLSHRESVKACKISESAKQKADLEDLLKELDDMAVEVNKQEDALKRFNDILQEKEFPKLRSM